MFRPGKQRPPHCQLDTILFVPPSAEAMRAESVREVREKQSVLIRNIIIICVGGVIICLIVGLVLGFKEQTLQIAGIAIPGLIGIVVFVCVIYWAMCLLLLPIYVYQIHRTLKKIEENTRKP